MTSGMLARGRKLKLGNLSFDGTGFKDRMAEKIYSENSAWVGGGVSGNTPEHR